MNKKTYGQGVRVERHDPSVVAATIAAKENMRDLLGTGEECKPMSGMSELEIAEAALDLAQKEWHEAENTWVAAIERRYNAEIGFRQAYDRVLTLRESKEAEVMDD